LLTRITGKIILAINYRLRQCLKHTNNEIVSKDIVVKTMQIRTE